MRSLDQLTGRGGTNGLLLPAGPFADIPPQEYKPDTVDNYEVGFKGRLGEISYTIDAFYIDWKDPQVSGLTPNANFAVWNAKGAESKGIEFEPAPDRNAALRERIVQLAQQLAADLPNLIRSGSSLQ